MPTRILVPVEGNDCDVEGNGNDSTDCKRNGNDSTDSTDCDDTDADEDEDDNDTDADEDYIPDGDKKPAAVPDGEKCQHGIQPHFTLQDESEVVFDPVA